ncbi:hypothetical protein HMPREF3226_00818 [Prevotella corporis]|uniref:Uncharacterized protein n=1 Tax=Prevotella corporis TaxID=28128 RepID=A0A133QF39_9BACT|nr:hypothetical protein HMPREF3226_00818 [Prevotella corporis]
MICFSENYKTSNKRIVCQNYLLPGESMGIRQSVGDITPGGYVFLSEIL